jgi:hypothetical protein
MSPPATGSHKWAPPGAQQKEGGGFHSVAENEITSSSGKDLTNLHREIFAKNLLGFDNASSERLVFDYAEVGRGAIAFHHQDLFHGSGVNVTASSNRRAMVLHPINGECKFNKNRRADYIYGRYQLMDEAGAPSVELNEKFFPVCWSRSDDETNATDKDESNSNNNSMRPMRNRSPWLDAFYSRFVGTNTMRTEGSDIFMNHIYF